MKTKSCFPLKYLILFLAGINFVSCKSHYQLVKANRTEYSISNQLNADSAILKDYQPYKQQLDAQMNAVIGRSTQELTKSNEPESLLGNFFSDAVLVEAKKIDPNIDFTMPSTKGGLRNILPKGDIRLTNVFELMPFENELVVLKLNGTDTQSFLTAIAASGGQPEAGLKMQIINKKPENVLIAGKPFDPNKSYTILTSDYVADGGDHINGLQNPQEKKVLGLKIRDALINYIKTQTAEGKPVNAELDGRITKN